MSTLLHKMGMSQGSLSAPILIGCIVSLVLRWLFQSWQFNRKYTLPVQIPGVPFLGNALQMPAEMQGPWAKAMAEKYGEMLVPSNCLTTPRSADRL
jgi:hypothetical protein